MKQIKIDLLNLETELNEIASWDDKFSSSENFRTIRKYVLEDNIYYSLREVINLNYEQYPIGDDEKHFIHSIKNEEDKIIGFIISDIFDIKTNPTLYIQYIVIHPLYQSLGYGSKALTEFLKNAETYVTAQPRECFARIECSNRDSLSVFEKAGFNFIKEEKSTFLRAKKYFPVLEKE